MKHVLSVCCFVCLVGVNEDLSRGNAQSIDPEFTRPVSRTKPENPNRRMSRPAEFQIRDIGPNHRVWTSNSRKSEPNGRVITHRSRFVELSSGMNHESVSSRDSGAGSASDTGANWIESRAEIALIPDGAVVREAQQRLWFAADLGDPRGVLQIDSEDNLCWRAAPLALAYFDPVSGRDAIVAVARPVPARWLPPNRMLYPDAFDGASADIVYTVSKTGVEQDVILREPPPAPSEFGFESESVQFEVLTEFLQAPDPRRWNRNIRDGARRRAGGRSVLVDELLDFGSLRIGSGRAFSIVTGEGAEGVDRSDSVPVGKRLRQIGERTVLFESVAYPAIRAGLDRLERRSISRTGRRVSRTEPDVNGPGRSVRSIPSRVLVKHGSEADTQIQVAATDPESEAGFVLDFVTQSGSLSNAVFAGDTTYYCSGTVLLTGVTTFEGGAVIKFAPDAQLVVQGAVEWLTDPGRPVIFTARDDDTVGVILPVSSGVLDGGYGDPMLRFDPGSAGYPERASVRDAHFRFAKCAIEIEDPFGFDHDLRHLQLTQCEVGLIASGAAESVYVGNALFDRVTSPFRMGTTSLDGEHLTVSGAGSTWSHEPESDMAFRNCLFVDCESAPSLSEGVNLVVASTPENSDLFVRAGAGHYYLAKTGAARFSGSTRIDPELLDDLRFRRTTEAPQWLGGVISEDLFLVPHPSEPGTRPDLGFHYARMDYAMESVVIRNAKLTIGPGTVVGSVGYQAIRVERGANLLCLGTPRQPVQFVRYFGVQEQPLIWGNPVYKHRTVTFRNDGSPRPTGSFGFTRFHGISDGGWHVHSDGGYWRPGLIRFEHCQTFNGESDFGGNIGDTISVFNSLWVRTAVRWIYRPAITLKHNLFWGGACSFNRSWGAEPWRVDHCAFDRCAVDESRPGEIVHGNNAYIGPDASLEMLAGSTSGNVVMDGFGYAEGPLGSFYHAGDQLRDRGALGGHESGLFHFTCQPDESREGWSVVDVGFHYPSTGPDEFVERVWIDESLPAGSVLSGQFAWASSNPAPFSGAVSMRSSSGSGFHQHYFYGATDTMTPNAGESLVARIYPDGTGATREIMMQWRGPSGWKHRAFWGEDLIPLGVGGTPSRFPAGPLPDPNEWRTLEVPVEDVMLAGVAVNGFAVSLFDGSVHWDRVGVGRRFGRDTDRDGFPDWVEDSDGNGQFDIHDGLDDRDQDGVVDRDDADSVDPTAAERFVSIGRPISRLGGF